MASGMGTISIYRAKLSLYYNDTLIGTKTQVFWGNDYTGSLSYTYTKENLNHSQFVAALRAENGTPVPFDDVVLFYSPRYIPVQGYAVTSPMRHFDVPISHAFNADDLYNTYGEDGYKLYIGDVRDAWIEVSLNPQTTSGAPNDPYYNIGFRLVNNGSLVSSSYCSVSVGVKIYHTYGGYLYQSGGYCAFPWFANYLGHSNICFSDWIGQIEYTIKYKSNNQGIAEDSLTWHYLEGYGGMWSSKSTFDPWLSKFGLAPIDVDNPYEEGGISEPGGGEGNFSEDSDVVTEDSLPTISAVNTGFATIFTPTNAQLKNLATIFWNGNVFAALQNLVENIDKMFVSLGIVPFEVSRGSTPEVTWLGLQLTSVYLTLAAQQYYEFDMGSIDLANDSRIYTSGSALDYSPFSKLGIYLPFIGYENLDIDECRDAVINLKYRIDILSGACVALINIGGNTIYQFMGNCLTQIPITSESMSSMVSDAVNLGIAIAGTVSASGAASADMSAIDNSDKMSAAQKEAHKAHAKVHQNSADSKLASASANAMMGMKPTYNKSGSVGSAGSLLSVRQPYLFLTTPNQSIPEHYQRYCGFPCNMTGKLGDFEGFTVVEDIRLNGLVATSPEVEEIYQLLKSGVII